MEKKKLQDIIKKKENDPKNVFLDNLNVNKTEKKEISLNEDVLFSKFNHEIKSYQKESKNKKQQNNIWFLVFVCMVFLFFAFFSLFAKAIVYINPKTVDFVLNQKISFDRKNTQNVGFVLVSMSGEEEKNVDFGKREYLEKKAEGKIVIFNDSNKAETFSSGTELLGLNGLKYFTKDKVVIPPASLVNEEKVAGFAEVVIEAEDFGEEYNYSNTNLVISKFKNTNKKDLFSVSGSEISGGVKGDVLLLDEEQKEQIVLELKEKLKNSLISKIKEQIPENSILFDDSMVFKESYEDSVLSEDRDFFNIKVKGTVYGILFEKENIIKAIAEVKLEEEEKKNLVKVKNLESLEFDFVQNIADIDFENLQSIEFFLSGDISFAWIVNEKEILSSLLGRSKKTLDQHLSSLKEIESAEVSIRPFWLKNIPEDPDKVDIIVNYPF